MPSVELGERFDFVCTPDAGDLSAGVWVRGTQG